MLNLKRLFLSFFFISFTFYFLFRNIDFRELWKNFVHFQILWIFPALAVYFAGYLIRGYRWVVLLSPIKKCSFGSLFPTLIIGFMANNVLPARAGEFIRAHLNGKKEGISRSSSFATIILERLFDGLTMIVLLWASMGFGRLPIQEQSMPTGIQHAIDWSPYVFGSAFVLLFLLLVFKKHAIQIILYVISNAPKRFHKPLENISHTFIDGLKILKNFRESLLVMSTSLAAWSCEATAYYFVAIGFGLAPFPLTWWSITLLMAVANLGILIPNAPGGIGLFEFIGVALLLPFSIPKETAVGFMFLVHFLVLIPITLLGFYYSVHDHVNLGRLESDKKAPARAKSPARRSSR